MSSSYFISVEVDAFGPIQDLSAALQRTYDNGAAGAYKILITRAPSFLILFQRDADDDREYVSARVNKGMSQSVESRAQLQLHDELVEGGLDDIGQAILEVLNNGEAQCFDFYTGAVESLVG